MNNDSKLKRFLSHNMTLFVMSLIIAFSIWFIISASSETDTNVTVSDIPITIELPQDALDDGLQVFSGADVTASVEVTGNRVTVGSLTPSDIQVVATQANSIIAPGSYTLELAAKKTGVKSNYNIVSSVSPSNITIYVDRLKEKEFTIENELVYQVSDEYYAAASLSESTVTVSGPEAEIASIDKVAVQGTIEGEVKESQNIDKMLIFLDKDGNELNLTLSETNVDTVTVALTVLPVMQIDLSVDVTNAPLNFPKINISPNSIKIAGSKDVLNSIANNTVVIGNVDFSKLRNEKSSLTFDITLPSGCKNLNNDSTAKVDIDLSNFVKKELNVTNFKATNIDLSAYNVSFRSNSIKVTVYGPKDIVDKISTDNITAIADASVALKNNDAKSLEMPLSLTFSFEKGFETCWVYGSYTENVNISKR